MINKGRLYTSNALASSSKAATSSKVSIKPCPVDSHMLGDGGSHDQSSVTINRDNGKWFKIIVVEAL